MLWMSQMSSKKASQLGKPCIRVERVLLRRSHTSRTSSSKAIADDAAYGRCAAIRARSAPADFLCPAVFKSARVQIARTMRHMGDARPSGARSTSADFLFPAVFKSEDVEFFVGRCKPSTVKKGFFDRLPLFSDPPAALICERNGTVCENGEFRPESRQYAHNCLLPLFAQACVCRCAPKFGTGCGTRWRAPDGDATAANDRESPL